MDQLRILVWHVHGSYLYYLTQSAHKFYLPSSPERAGDLAGKWGHIPWGDNVMDVPVQEVRNLDLDVILFQLPGQYLTQQDEILSDAQRKLPRIYLEHDPPHAQAKLFAFAFSKASFPSRKQRAAITNVPTESIPPI